MKIRITQTVEIDPQAWATEYGVDIKDVRDDVQSYFSGWFQQQVAQLGLDPQKKPLRIKAMWTQWGPRFHHAGRNTDCVGDHSSWTLAGYDLQKWIERNHPGATPEFYGPSAAAAKEGWEESNR